MQPIFPFFRLMVQKTLGKLQEELDAISVILLNNGYLEHTIKFSYPRKYSNLTPRQNPVQKNVQFASIMHWLYQFSIH